MRVAIDGVRLFFDIVGERLALTPEGLREKPTLLCLHGGPGGDHMSLRPELDALSSLAQVVYLDQRGGGRSDEGPVDSWTMDRWADDVADFCDALEIKAPIVFGHSGGAMVALHYAARHPDHACALILAGAATRIVREERIADFARRGGPDAEGAARAMFMRCAPEDFLRFLQHCLPFYAKRAAPDAAARAARGRFGATVNRHFFAPDGEAWRMDLRSDLSRITCPTLVISGIDDPITPPEMGREVAAGVAGARFVLLEQSSHQMMTDEPERFLELVSSFVSRLG